MNATHLASMIITGADALFEGFCKLVVVLRTPIVGHSPSFPGALIRTVAALIHGRANSRCGELKRRSALLTSQFDQLLRAGGIIARLRAIGNVFCALGFVRLAAMLTGAGDALALPKAITGTRTKDVGEPLAMIGVAVNFCTAIVAGIRHRKSSSTRECRPQDWKSGRWVWRPSLSAGSNSAQALTTVYHKSFPFARSKMQ